DQGDSTGAVGLIDVLKRDERISRDWGRGLARIEGSDHEPRLTTKLAAGQMPSCEADHTTRKILVDETLCKLPHAAARESGSLPIHAGACGRMLPGTIMSTAT